MNFQAAYVHGGSHPSKIFANGDIPVTNDTLYRSFERSNWYNSSEIGQLFVDGKFYTGRKVEHKVLAGFDYCNAAVSAITTGIFEETKFWVIYSKS